jgi:dTDP-4-dehydrorhamnose 3,5-epimerase
MNFERLAIPDVVLFQPTAFSDDRGLFFESFSQRIFDATIGVSVPFVQDNHSLSKKNVIRGLHYQVTPHAQGKLVRVARGAVFDVAVDLRQGSSTFGRWVGARLSAENRHQLWIPEGFAHGFVALEENTEFLYKTTDFYHKESERAILWNDKDIGIDWPLDGPPLVSEKDSRAVAFREAFRL